MVQRDCSEYSVRASGGTAQVMAGKGEPVLERLDLADGDRP